MQNLVKQINESYIGGPMLIDLL